MVWRHGLHSAFLLPSDHWPSAWSAARQIIGAKCSGLCDRLGMGGAAFVCVSAREIFSQSNASPAAPSATTFGPS